MVGPTLASVKYSRLALPSGTLGGATRTQELQHLLDANHVAVLGVHVVEVRLVGVGVAVPHGLPGYDGPEAVLEGVYDGGPNAARSGCPGNDEGIHPGGGEEAVEPCAEETGGKELVEDRLRRAGRHAGVDLRPTRSGFQGEERRNFVDEGGGRVLVRLPVNYGGIRDGDLRLPGYFQQLLYLGDWAVEVAAQRR